MLNLVRAYATSIRNKLTKKLWGVIRLRTNKQKKGSVLFSFVTIPFTFLPGKSWTDPHPHYYACTAIAELFLERGYDVDIINWDNTTFIPKKKYAACIDIQQNLERLSPLLGPQCKKVMHIVSSHAKFQNEAEQKRIDALEKRRGAKLFIKRPEKPNENARFADFLEGYGNKSVFDTYGDLAKKIISIPVFSSEFYDYQKNKNFAEARRHFLWFGGGGAILKGLDLIVEAFAKMPEYTISLVGPAPYEKEFERVYERELALPNIRRYPRPIIHPEGNMVGDRKLEDVMKECVAIIFPSASEGAGASVVQAMQAGVIPITTPSSGIDERINRVIDASIESIIAVAKKVALTDPTELARESQKVWEFARTNHSKETYIKRFGDFIDNTLKL